MKNNPILWSPLIFGVVVAGALCAVTVTHPGSAIPSIIAGLAAAVAVGMHREANSKIHGEGDRYRAAERVVSRNEDFLISNPWLHAVPEIRRRLLPTDSELDAFGFSDSWRSWLVELRDERHNIVGGSSRIDLPALILGHYHSRRPLPPQEGVPA